MDYKDIENKLKADAENIEQKKFPDRWAEIQTRMEGPESVTATETVTSSDLVTEGVTQGEVPDGHSSKKPSVKVIAILVVAFVIAALAIILPLTLKQNNVEYFSKEQLLVCIIDDKETFYSDLKNADISVVDLTGYEVANYRIYYVGDYNVKGGGFEILDEDSGYYVNVVFYNSSVKISSDLTDCEICYANGTEVKYTLQQDDEGYLMVAAATCDGVQYKLSGYISGDNVDEILSDFFN